MRVMRSVVGLTPVVGLAELMLVLSWLLLFLLSLLATTAAAVVVSSLAVSVGHWHDDHVGGV
jgi:membrane protease YdiL (CAAX protease family)